MAQVETTFGADSSTVRNPNHVRFGRDPAATPKSTVCPSDKIEDGIHTENSQTATGGTEAIDSINAGRFSAVNHGQERVEHRRSSVSSQQTNPPTNPGAEASLALLAAKAFGAARVTDAQDLPQPETTGHSDVELTIVIASSDDESPQKQTNEGGTGTKPAKRTRKKRAPNNGSVIDGDDALMNVNSAEGPVVPSAGFRPLRKRRSLKAPKTRAPQSLNRQKSSVASKTVPPPADDTAKETTSTGGPAGTKGPHRTTEKNKPQSDSNLVDATDAGSRLGVLQPELDSGGRRDDEDDTRALGYADGDCEAKVGEDAGVSELGHNDPLPAQIGSRSANTRLGTNQRDRGKGQSDEIADSDAEPDNEDAGLAVRQPTTALQESAKRKREVVRDNAATKLQKRRQTPKFSTQKRRADVAFRDSSSDSAGAQNGDISDGSHYGGRAHHECDNGTAQGTTQVSGPQIDIGNLTTGGGAPHVTPREVAGDMSDTTQEVDWSPLTNFRSRAATKSPQWQLSNATLLDTHLGEDGFLKYKIGGLWKLANDSELSFSGNTATV